MAEYTILDLFAGAGGSGMGYHQAGFDVIGVDKKHQKNYPFVFRMDDAIDTMQRLCAGEKVLFHDGEYRKLSDIDAIHASPPCQRYSAMTKGRWKDRVDSHPDLIGKIRSFLVASRKPYVIENVWGARSELLNPVMLCGTMFGLQTKQGSQLRRHRLFETNFPLKVDLKCNHIQGINSIGVYGGGQNPNRKKLPSTIGVYGNSGGSSNRDGLLGFTTQDRRDAMGISWMSGKELSEAIPPAYTKFIGKQLIEYLKHRNTTIDRFIVNVNFNDLIDTPIYVDRAQEGAAWNGVNRIVQIDDIHDQPLTRDESFLDIIDRVVSRGILSN